MAPSRTRIALLLCLTLSWLGCAPDPGDSAGAALLPGAPDTPALSASPASLLVGGTVSLAITGDPGGRLDWVGLFKSAGSDEGVIDWLYLNGSKSPPAAGTDATTLTFPMPTVPGTYNLRLMANDGYVKLATSNDVQVMPAPVISASPDKVLPGGAAMVSVTHDPGSTTDWIALCKSGDPDTAVVDWVYLNGTRTPPREGLSNAFLFFAMPSTPGTYNFRLFSNNGYARLAQSNDIQVPAPLYNPQIAAAPLTVPGGRAVTLTISDAPGSPFDWVALFKSSDGDGGVISWMYLNGGHSAPATGVHAATLSFPMPLTPGSYNFRLFADGRYAKLATSNDVQVGVGPKVAVSTTWAAPGERITVSISDGSGNRADWVGLGKAGEDHLILDWVYLNGQRTAPATGLGSASVAFTLPQEGGEYVFRLYADDGFEILAQSPVVDSPRATSVAGGFCCQHLALKSDGTVWAWGRLVVGSRPFPFASPSGVTAIAAGAYHSLALKGDGTVWAWGQNYAGQLGNGTTTDSATPVQVVSLGGVAAIAAGSLHSLALKKDGTVWAFGLNDHGQLGDGTTTNRPAPVQVAALSGVTAIAQGANHSLALKSDGTVWGWGHNATGQLGDGTTADRATPVQVRSLGGVTAIAGGWSHSLALKKDGTAWAWGLNQGGALGDGTTTDSATPVQVAALSGVTALAAGDSHSLAITNDGAAWAWGSNQTGQLGNGTMIDSTTPVQVAALSGVTAIVGGYAASFALKSNGTIWAWGAAVFDQLGTDISARSDLPARVLLH